MMPIKYYQFFVLAILLTCGSCDGCRSKDTDKNLEQQESTTQANKGSLQQAQTIPPASKPSTSNTISSLTLEMIETAKAGNGNNYIDLRFLVKQLEKLKNGEVGVDINEKSTTHGDMTALHGAVLLRDVEIIKALLDRKADVNAQEDSGMTPLHRIAIDGNAEIAKLLLANGAKLEVKDNLGYTALYWAVWSGKKEVAELLINAGADIGTTDTFGRTLLQRAKIMELNGSHVEIIALLSKAGCSS